MEAGAPGINSSGPRSLPKDAMPIERVTRPLAGLPYYLSFLLLLSGIILSIISIVKDDITKLKFTSYTGHYVEYCGWKNIHSYDSSTSFLEGAPYTMNYSKECKNWNMACTLDTIGTAWYSLLIIGIVFGGLALLVYLFNISALLAALLIFACNFLFFGCLLANALIWGIYKTCHKACHNKSFPDLPLEITKCKPEWGISWILVIVAGGCVLLSTLLALMSTRPKKNY